jgi:hypothetical protein
MLYTFVACSGARTDRRCPSGEVDVSKAALLRGMVRSAELEFLMEAHDGLSARIAEEADGALLLRLGALATNGTHGPANLLHVVLNNACHESTGGQATVAENVESAAVAAACGVARAFDVADVDELRARFAAWQRGPEPTFLHLRTTIGTAGPLMRPELARPQVQERFRRRLACIADGA